MAHSPEDPTDPIAAALPSAPVSDHAETEVFPGVILERTNFYREADERAAATEAVVEKLRQQQAAEPGGFSATITAVLEELLALGKLDGLTVASDEGLVIAETHRLPNGEIMAAIGAVFESVADRAQHAGIVAGVEEMTLQGTAGEMAVVRYFPRLDRRFFLMAYSAKKCCYRRVTNLALIRCGALLERRFGTREGPPAS